MLLTYLRAEAERRGRAWLHDEEMGRKYNEIHNTTEAFRDYHYWHELPQEGYRTHRDYPLPYSERHYFRRFAELFLSRGSESNMQAVLAHEFLGDGIDADYIEGLLITAADCGFFTPNALIQFDASGVEFWPPPANGGHYLPPPPKGGYREDYFGSKVNKARVEVIRKWLARRAAELPHTTSGEISATRKDASVVGQPRQAPTVADLCNPTFTPSDLSELLLLLGVIDSKDNCLTNSLKGKASAKKGAFAAAYRVLHRAGLMAPASNGELIQAFKWAYKAELANDAISRELTAHGNAPSSAPRAFAQAVEITKDWLLTRQKRPKPSL